MKPRVFVGLSGGVDSGVSAALLKDAGYDVTGVFIKIWQPEFIECTWREDRLDAMRIAAALHIPFREIDLSDAYKHDVVEPMLASYEAGRTPNPDVLCNERIKFGHFFAWARSQGAQYVATGHYARAHEGSLLRGLDTSKDQSYFLHRVAREELLHTFFPVGGLEKSRVRNLAEHYRLPVAQKPDSQGLCFVGPVTIGDFIGRFAEVKEGDVLDRTGTKIGTHSGALLYTRGQRHGFEIDTRLTHAAAHFVINTDVAHNTITVSTDRADASSRFAEISDMHWIGESIEIGARADVQLRYRETPREAVYSFDNGYHRFTFTEPHIAAVGQSLVVYRGERCIGGGPIESACV